MKKKLLSIFYAIVFSIFTSCTSDWVDENLRDDAMVIFDANGGDFYSQAVEDELFDVYSGWSETIWLPDEQDFNRYPDGWHFDFINSDYYLTGFMLNFNQEIYPPNTRFEITRSSWRAYYNGEIIDSGDMPSNHTFIFKAVWKKK